MNELKIGNWVIYKNKLSTVDMLVAKAIGFDGMLIQEDEIKPIPLTEEWLIKFGFKPKGEGYSLNNYLVCSFKDFSDGSSEYSLYEWDSYNEVEVCIKGGIKYVHQLQNLFFALTNNELL